MIHLTPDLEMPCHVFAATERTLSIKLGCDLEFMSREMALEAQEARPLSRLSPLLQAESLSEEAVSYNANFSLLRSDQRLRQLS